VKPEPGTLSGVAGSRSPVSSGARASGAGATAGDTRGDGKAGLGSRRSGGGGKATIRTSSVEVGGELGAAEGTVFGLPMSLSERGPFAGRGKCVL